MLEQLDPDILLSFVEEAQGYLPVIRNSIAEYEADATRLEELTGAHRHIHTIRGAALMIGLTELSELAAGVEETLDGVTAVGQPLTAPVSSALLAKLDQMEETLVCTINELQNSEQWSVVGSQFSLDEIDPEFLLSFDEPSANATTIQPLTGHQSTTTVDEDVDAEMLEVFALEAEEHLQNITVNLAALEQNSGETNALREVRRSSHTLKGAAGVIGFRVISTLAHRMEDLLDQLAEQPALSNAKTTALLMATTDVLERLTRGADANAVSGEISILNLRYDAILSDVNNHQETVAAPVATVAKSPEPQLAKPESHEQPAHSGSRVMETARRPVVRVTLDRLDEIVKLMGEVIISRTVLEGRLSEIEGQVRELSRSTSRLKRIAGKLEIDYEASALAGNGWLNPLSGFGGAGQNELLAIANSVSMASAMSQPTVHFRNSGGESEFDDLEFDRYTEFHQTTRELVETSNDSGAITGDLDGLLGDFDGLLLRQRRLTDEMHEKLMRLRMVPFNTLLTRLERTVRVTAESAGKLADLRVEGETVELDSNMLDALAEPLLHLIRNSIGHGLETPAERVALGKPERGTISLRIEPQGTHLVFAITDDGRGINIEKLREKAVKSGQITIEEAAAMSDQTAANLVFLPGVSTAAAVSELSGRGVGMDIVRETAVGLGGSVTISTARNVGTTTLVRLPLSLVAMRALIVSAAGQGFAVPLGSIAQLVSVNAEDFDYPTRAGVLTQNGESYPVMGLNQLLKLGAMRGFEAGETRIPVLLVRNAGGIVAVVLDSIGEAREIVVKPLGSHLGTLPGLLGATILGNGAVLPILDLPGLVAAESDARSAGVPVVKYVESISTHKVNTVNRQTRTDINVLIVDDSPSVRRVMTNLMRKSGWNTMVAKDGLEAIELLQTARTLPDVILSDIEMPRMDGYELVATLKRQPDFSRIPVVMITSRAGDKHRAKAQEMGVAAYITKPYDDVSLVDVIENLAA